MPVANAMAAEELRRFGAAEVLAHIELEQAAVAELAAASPLPVQLYRFGRPVLLMTRAELPVTGDLHDRRGNGFTVAPGRDKLTRLYPEKIVSLPRMAGVRDFYDLRRAHWGAEDTAAFNFASELA